MIKKQKLDEKVEVNEENPFQPQPVQPPRGPDASAAAATLHPHSNDVPDPKADLSFLQRVIGQLGQIDASKEEWENNAQGSMASLCGNGGGVGDNSAHNRDTIKAKASDAVGNAVKEDLDKILDSELSEEARFKAKTLYEAAIAARMIIERQSFEEEKKEFEAAQEVKLTEEVELITEQLTEAVGEYVDYAAQEWQKVNEVAIESTLRNEIAKDLLEGLRNLFMQNNIAVPEEQVEVVDAMSEKIDELEKRLATAISENADLKRNQESTSKKEIADQVSEGLTVLQAEKLKELSENLDYDSLNEFKTKLETIKESNFLKEPKKSLITEDLEDVDTSNEPPVEETYSSPEMKVYAQAIARQMRNK